MKKTLKIIASILAVGLLGYVAFVWYVAYVVFDTPFDNKEFDKIVWQKYHKDMNPDNPRGEMYKSLIEDYLKQGMTKREIIQLLGEPDYKDEENLLSYNLGMWSGFRIDYDSLDLNFSNDGNLVKYYRVQH